MEDSIGDVIGKGGEKGGKGRKIRVSSGVQRVSEWPT